MTIQYLEIVTPDVDAVCAAYAAAETAGAQVALPPMEIPGVGTFAITIQGGVNHGYWQK